MRPGRILAASVALLLAAAAAAAPVLRDFDGAARGIDDYTGMGRWVVVMLWASDCHVCNEEAAALEAFHRGHGGRDAIVLGVALDGWDGREAARGFVDRHRVSFDNLLGEPADVAAMYSRLTGRRWVGTPTFLVYGPDGTLLAQQVGAIETEVIEDFIARHPAR